MAAENIFDDKELTVRIAGGEMNAFKDLFNKYYAPLCYFAQKLTKDPAEAEDAVMQVFSKIWQNKAQLTAVSNIRSFIYKSVQHACLDFLRVKNRTVYSHGEVEWLSEQGMQLAEKEAMFTRLLQELYEEVERLPPQCRTIFKLLYYKNMSTRQVAEELELSVQTVRNQKNRALQLLRDAFEKKGDLFFGCFLLLYVLSS